MLRRAATGLAVVALAAVTGCAAGAETGGRASAATGATTPTASASATASPTAAASGSPSPAATPAFAGVSVVVTVRGGKVSPPPKRVQVKAGQQVRITVTSDEADGIHVHGYDLEKPLPAGKAATLEFTANRAGLFEVETHETGKQLFQLVVR